MCGDNVRKVNDDNDYCKDDENIASSALAKRDWKSSEIIKVLKGFLKGFSTFFILLRKLKVVGLFSLSSLSL